MNDGSNNLPTIQPLLVRSTRPKDQDLPGWNDPPPLKSCQTTTGSGVKPKLDLKKRIVFPLNSNNMPKPTAVIPPQISSQQIMSIAPVAMIPPMPQESNVLNEPMSTFQQNIQRVPPMLRDENFEHQDIREYCIKILKEQLIKLSISQALNLTETDSALNMIFDNWITCNESVHRKLFDIAEALKNKNFDDAISAHNRLISDHFDVCAPWEKALKDIIQMGKQQMDSNRILNETIQ